MQDKKRLGIKRKIFKKIIKNPFTNEKTCAMIQTK
jgi:hypothetical protein